MNKPRQTQLPPTPVRLPLDLKSQLKNAAITNQRSLNGEIVHRLRASLIPTTKEQQQ